jgi:hypothetical protein
MTTRTLFRFARNLLIAAAVAAACALYAVFAVIGSAML